MNLKEYLLDLNDSNSFRKLDLNELNLVLEQDLYLKKTVQYYQQCLDLILNLKRDLLKNKLNDLYSKFDYLQKQITNVILELKIK